MRRVAAGLAAAILAGLCAAIAPAASAYAPAEGVFAAEAACPALVSIRRESNPGDVATVPGRSYVARALNRIGGDHVQIEIPEAAPPLRWVRLSCGTLRPAAAPARAGAFAPFFDEIDAGPGDPTPPPPRLGPFDRALLAVCGPWGSRPSRQAFRRMLDDPGLAAEVSALYASLDRAVLDGPASPDRFKDELTALWFRAGGFAHIFCGEPGPGGVGGLHFAGRYYEMQQRGWGGLAAASACRREIAPPVYTLGLRYRMPSGAIGTACPKGYAHGLDAAALLGATTRAARQAAARGLRDGMCLAAVEDAGVARHVAVLVLDRGAVRSFYPDASPRCDDGGPARGCACGR